MNDVLSSDIIEEFESITSFSLSSYLQSFKSFVKQDVSSIVNYYSGNISTLNTTSFNNLKSLIETTQDLFAIFALNQNVFQNYKWWVFISEIEKFESFLMTIDNSSKWLRSTISKANFNPNPEVDIPFNQGQTLESISRDILGSKDWSNTWSDLALKNDLREEDYTSEGGFLIKANFDYVQNNFQINSIVDNPIDERILGIDLHRKLQFDTTTQDLLVLSPKDTFFQNVTILINLRQGDNPEFYNQGINPKLIVGSNVNSLAYPVLFRQLSSLFKADDTIKSFMIIAINRLQDSVSIEFQVESRLGDLQNISLTA
jgi:hypothetical protein